MKKLTSSVLMALALTFAAPVAFWTLSASADWIDEIVDSETQEWLAVHPDAESYSFQEEAESYSFQEEMVPADSFFPSSCEVPIPRRDRSVGSLLRFREDFLPELVFTAGDI